MHFLKRGKIKKKKRERERERLWCSLTSLLRGFILITSDISANSHGHDLPPPPHTPPLEASHHQFGMADQ